MNSKSDLRKHFQSLRLKLTVMQRHAWLAAMLEHFEAIPLWPPGAILSYCPLEEKNEVPTSYFEEAIINRQPEGKTQICYPKVNWEDNSMEAVADDGNLQTTTTHYGLVQPQGGQTIPAEALQAVLVPMLAFDERGYRLGYGKGFYDRFLARCRPSVLKIGLSWFEPIAMLPQTGPFDLPLNYCVTPQRLYVF